VMVLRQHIQDGCTTTGSCSTILRERACYTCMSSLQDQASAKTLLPEGELPIKYRLLSCIPFVSAIT